MSDQNTRNDEFLLLTDEEGNYFAIPRGTVEQYRAEGEQKELYYVDRDNVVVCSRVVYPMTPYHAR